MPTTGRRSPDPRPTGASALRGSSRAGPAAIALALGLCLSVPGPALADERRPLATLPYTPGLDVTAMDTEANACQDFFQYSCGGWIRRNPIPPDKASWDVYSKLNEENLQYLWGILEQASDTTRQRDAIQRQIGDYFAACMDTGAIEARGLGPLAPALADIAALASREDLPALIARLHGGLSNGDLLFGYASLQDFEDSQTFIGTFFSGGIGLPERDYYLSGEPKMREARERYRAHIERMFSLTGSSADDAALAAGQVLAIETRLATATLPPVDQQDPTKLNHPISAEGLQADAPGFDWVAYLKLRSPGTLDRVNVTEPAFATEVGKLVADTPIEELKVYLRWGMLRGHARMLPKAIADESFAFNSAYLYGVKQEPPRWLTCVSRVDEDLGEALGREFVAHTFSAGTRKSAVEMIEIIQQVMHQRIEQLDWMSDATQKRALEKLDAMRNKVGYPETWRDYSSVVIDRGDYFGNRVRAVAFEEDRLLARIGKPVDPDEWQMTPQTVNAYYDWLRNDMNFPAGILQPPLFDLSIDAAPSWGNTGMTVGHELIHGFDDTGRNFDARGNLSDWWTAEDAAEFEKRTQCLLDQYANYTIVDDIRINSRMTLGEDIADLAGTILAYLGWKVATEGQALEPREGLTPEQRFFVGSAQWACGHETEERSRVLARVSAHSPLRHRVNGVMVNMPEFARAFSCKPGDAMYRDPKEVCRIW